MATWVVNSYGYPNPFQDSAKAREAWEMFDSFAHRPSYRSVKAHWEHHASRPVQPSAVESWKATFEEFGLLYVPKASDKVLVTPGGRQLLDAASANADRDFVWVGLNLLLRYPLRGKAGRRSRGDEFDRSDLPLYWFLYAALFELDGFWQQELFRILSSVFLRSDARSAIETVRRLRSGEEDITLYADPSGGATGKVYNALNQVMVHGSLNHMTFTSAKDDSRYFKDARENWWYLRDQHRDLAELALGGCTNPTDACVAASSLIERIPAVPNFSDEQDYFDHVGAPVPDLAEAQARATAAVVPTAEYGGETVSLLTVGLHCVRRDTTHVVGPATTLCRLAERRRVLVSDDLDVTFIVEHKELSGSDAIVRLRRARPIVNRPYVERLFAGGSNG